MATTLKEVLKAVENFRIHASCSAHPKSSLAQKFLGKFKRIIPRGKTSAQYIKELRSSLYGKIK